MSTKKESTNIKRTEFMTIINNLISSENIIENEINEKENEFKNLSIIPPEQENEVYRLINRNKLQLESFKERLGMQITVRSSCIDGRPGKIKLECGHYICSICFFKVRETASKNQTKGIPCLGCGGIEQNISKQ